MMNITTGSGSKWTTADADEGMTEGDTEWKAHDSETPDRTHVDSLLDINEESHVKEFPNEMHVHAWEEAVKGWDECPPLDRLFELQNKCKLAKTGEHESHCLLCIDTKNSVKPEHADSKSLETCSNLIEDYKGKSIYFPAMHLERPSRSSSANSDLNTERDSFKDKEEATIQTESGNKASEKAKQHIRKETLPKLAYMKLSVQCELIKEGEIFNKFTILPPVKGTGYPGSTSPTRGSVAASTLSSADSLTAGTRSYGVPMTEKRRVEGSEISPESPVDSHGSHSTKCYQSLPNKQVPSAFSISIPNTCGSLDNTLSRATYFAGRKIKSDTPISTPENNNQGHNQKQPEPQLPLLLVTRIPLLAASNRILNPSNV